MPNALYVHRDALDSLEPLLRVYEGCARAYLGEVEARARGGKGGWRSEDSRFAGIGWYGGGEKGRSLYPKGLRRRWPHHKPLRPFGYRLLNEAASRWADCLPPMEIGRRDRLPVDAR